MINTIRKCDKNRHRKSSRKEALQMLQQSKELLIRTVIK